jgi:phospholipid/cholesterol/gamma-HCH transport system permease protein
MPKRGFSEFAARQRQALSRFWQHYGGLDMFRHIGERTLSIISRLGRATLFLYETIVGMTYLIPRFSLVVQQVFNVGVLTLLIILVSGLFVGMVLALQGYNTLVTFGAEDSLGLVVALTLVRELGPVVTALLFAGRAGSALTAEIGLMKATEQLAGMEMMAVNPIKRVIAPRFLAGVIAMPLLASMFSAVGVFGGHLIGVGLVGLDSGSYWSQMQSGVDFYDDIMNGLMKSVVFGFTVSWIAVFEGYDATPTSEGVSRATNHTVVYSSLAVLALDFILTSLTLGEV